MSSYSDLASQIINKNGQGGAYEGLNTALDIKKSFDDAVRQYSFAQQLKQQENFASGASHILSTGALNGVDMTPTVQNYARTLQGGVSGAANAANGTPPAQPTQDGQLAVGNNGNVASPDTTGKLPGFKGIAQQDKLEKNYADRLDKVLSNRSGGLGQMDSKVNQAILARQLLDQYYDPATKKYNVPQAQYTDLAISLATLLAPNTQASDAKIEQIKQRTAQGDFNGILSYVTGAPKNATSTDMIQNLADSIDREGLRAESNREKYLNNLRGQFPKALDENTRSRLEANSMANSFKEYLSTPIEQRQNPDGLNKGTPTPNQAPASPDGVMKTKSGNTFQRVD